MKDILNVEKPFYNELTADQRKQYEEITEEMNSVGLNLSEI